MDRVSSAFLEAASYGCAILSEVDPDGFASQFGYHAADGDFSKGLRALLENDLWQVRAMAGQTFVAREFALALAIDQHLTAYQRLA